MVADFRMPSLGADMEAGTVVEWRVAPGDVVRRGDVVVVIETEKATIEAEVFVDGVVDQLVVEVGQEAEVGALLATLTASGEEASLTLTETPTAAPAPLTPARPAPSAVDARPRHVTHSPLVRHLAEQAHLDLVAVDGTGAGGALTRRDVERAIADRGYADPHARAAPPVAFGGEPGRVKASPLARRRAAALGIDLKHVTGTGPEGAVVTADLVGVTPSTDQGASPAVASRHRPAADASFRRRVALGNLMARSKREIPHYYLSTTVEVGGPWDRLREANERRPVAGRVLPAAVLLWATAQAAAEVPVMNGHWVDGVFVPGDAVHLGVAISLRGGGLVAPSLRDAERCSVAELMVRLRDLVGRARTGALRTSELSDPTITVTNLGDQGVESVFGVIYPPQVALVGFGTVVERPWAVDGMLAVRPVLTATLSADHRASDGHDGARFLTLLAHHLQEPELP